jgi:F0F1-type ATP synthase assembly protein I
MGFGRYLDLAVLAGALPVFLVAGLPIVAWAAIAAAWLAQRAVQHWAAGRVAHAGDRTSALKVILTVAILVVGIAADDEAGLSAAVLAAVLVTANFAGEAIARPKEVRP